MNERLLALFTSRQEVFWRHDVDLSLGAAAKMAQFAQLAGVQSTFYIMPRAEFYNPFSREGERALGVIADCGHRIGLHCDYRANKLHDAVWPEVERQRRMLLNVYGEIVDPRLVSFHMPTPEVLWTHFEEFENAYAPMWLGRYLSDSRGILGNEEVLKLEGPIQVNLHPEHWFQPGGRRG